MDLSQLPIDLVEILNKITPNEDEQKKFQKFSKDKKNPKSLPDNDRFLFEVCYLACSQQRAYNLCTKVNTSHLYRDTLQVFSIPLPADESN